MTAPKLAPGRYTREELEAEIDARLREVMLPGIECRTDGHPPVVTDSRRLYPWERAQIVADLMVARERRQRRLSIALWFAVVVLIAIVLGLTFHRSFDDPGPGRPSSGAQHGAGAADPGTQR